MNSAVSRDDLFGACQALFGPQARPGGEFLAGLDTAALRRQFRRKAMDVHPDRAAALRRHPAALAEAFMKVEAAYRTLCEHLNAGARAARASPPTARSTAAPTAHPAEPHRGSPVPKTAQTAPVPSDHFWSGPVPSRTLRLGEYLYYTGRISWMNLIRALAWQGRQRPRFGQVAARLGYLSPELIAEALSRRQSQERIGEAALRLRLITRLQQHVVLDAQSRGGSRIGGYFVQSGLLLPSDLDGFMRGAWAHNARVTFAR